MIGPYDIVLCCYEKRFRLSIKFSLSEPRPCFHVREDTYLSLKTSTELFFFPFLFSSYFRSVDARVFSIVSGRCNHSSSALFYDIFESFFSRVLQTSVGW